MTLEEKTTLQRQRILRVLLREDAAMTGVEISRVLAEDGLQLGERSVRLYLEQLQSEGLVQGSGRSGKMLSERGREEAASIDVMQRVGSLSSKIDALTFGMSFDLHQKAGTVVVNSCILPSALAMRYIQDFCEVYKKGFAMGQLVGLIPPESDCFGSPVPKGHIGLCTVCSITLSGILLHQGIPVRSIFGGLLQIEAGQATRFCELISYEGSSVDPLEIFIKAGMADYLGAVYKGRGRIGAGFREIPSRSRGEVQQLAQEAAAQGLGALLVLGRPEQMLLNIPVRPGSTGFVAIGGVNPFSVYVEHGHHIKLQALSGLLDFRHLFSWEELPARLKVYL